MEIDGEGQGRRTRRPPVHRPGVRVVTNILDGLPTNAAAWYWGEYKARVETALGRFRALGLSRYNTLDGPGR